MFYRKHYFYPDMAKNFQTTQGPVAFAMYGHLDLDVTGRGAAERPDCAFGEAEAQSLASASANAEGLSTSMTSTMREGNQRAGHLASYDASNLQMPERREDGSYTVPIRDERRFARRHWFARGRDSGVLGSSCGGKKGRADNIVLILSGQA